MTADLFAFTRLLVQRMPGVASGGWVLDGLSPGINVICGPNGSGKSTTARALETLLWPQELAGPQTRLTGGFLLHGAAWHAEVDGTSHKYQRDGSPADPPALPPAGSVRSRYSLALQDLLAAQDEDFAHAIGREAAGGYDVAAAAGELKFCENAPRTRALRQHMDQACAALREACVKEEALEADLGRLESLGRQVQEAEEARAKAALLQRAVEGHRHLAAAALAGRRFAEFDPRLERINGGEAGQFAARQRELADLVFELENAQRTAAAALEAISACQLPDGGIAAGLLTALRAELEQWRTLEARAQETGRALAGALAREEEARRLVGEQASAEALAGLDAVAVGRLAEFSGRIELLQGRRKACQAMGEWLATPAARPDPAPLMELQVLLLQWLRDFAATTVAGPGKLPGWLKPLLICAALLAAAGSILLALNGAPAAYGGLLIAALIAFALTGLRPGAAAPAAVPVPQVPPGVEPPARWEAEAVRERLAGVQRELAAAALEAERFQRHAHLEEERAELEKELAVLESESEALAERYGWPPPEGRAFHTFGAALARWQQARADHKAAAAELETLRGQSAAPRARIQSLLGGLGMSGASTIAEAGGHIEDLKERDQRWREATATRAGALELAGQLERQRQRCEAELARIRETTGAADEIELRALCAQVPAWSEARKQRDAAAGLLREAETFFTEHPDLRAQTVEELEALREAASAQAASLAALAAQQGRIQAEIQAAKEGHGVEEALAAREDSMEALLQERERSLAALAGHLVAGHVAEISREQALPQVFHRARSLFTQITAGAERLEIDLEAGAFRALESGAAGRCLDELSSGTRVQLLLAVRAAFVAEQEGGVRLPLFLDEALGNSDDQRSRAIIAALAGLARDGRQIFYFTAQQDEVARWQDYLAGHPEIPHRCIDLGRERRLAPAGAFPRVALPPRPAPPAPGTLSYEQYGRLLAVPDFDPRQPAASLHLWHLCEDGAQLHRLLEMGLERWGQLEDCLRFGGLAMPEADLARLRAGVQLHEELARCWQHGRTKPLDRQALEEGGVSGTFIERVWELCQQCNLDGRSLLLALEEKRVSGFQNKARERLAAHLEAHGFLSHDTPLDGAAIRLRMAPLAHSLGIGRERLEGVLGKIAQP